MRTAVDTDGKPLRLPGWDGDDVIVAPDADALAEADPVPIIVRAGARTLASKEAP